MELLKWAIACLIAVASVTVTVFIFLYNNRRKKLEIDTRVESLIVARLGRQEQLEVRFNDRLVSSPYIIDFTAANIGHKDITSKDFDSDQPLKVNLGAEVVALLRIQENDQGRTLLADTLAGTLLVMPAKLQVGVRHQVRLLVDGQPEIDIDDNHPLIDTDVVIGADLRSREARVAKRTTNVVLGVCLVALLTMSTLIVLQKKLAIKTGTVWFVPDAIVSPHWAVIVFWAISLALLPVTILTLWTIFRPSRISRVARLSEPAD